MKKDIKITISQYLFKLINQNPILFDLFSDLFAYNLIDYRKINNININLLFYNNYLYFIIKFTLTNKNYEIFYGKLKTNEINININNII